jgi:hypothetical protein
MSQLFYYRDFISDNTTARYQQGSKRGNPTPRKRKQNRNQENCTKEYRNILISSCPP